MIRNTVEVSSSAPKSNDNPVLVVTSSPNNNRSVVISSIDNGYSVEVDGNDLMMAVENCMNVGYRRARRGYRSFSDDE